MIEILPVGVAVDHGAAELELAHAALELVRGGVGTLHGEMREAMVAVRPLGDLGGEKVVRFLRLAAGGLDVALGLGSGAGDGQHCLRDPTALHGREPLLAELGQPRGHLA